MEHPHLTPSQLFPGKTLPGIWSQAKIAYICFTPFPEGFEAYVEAISEVYGFAVGTTTVEELVHYGIDTIIGVGYVGAFNGAAPGEMFIASYAMSDLPLASHFGYKELEPVYPSHKLNDYLTQGLDTRNESWGVYPVWNSNSHYREFEETVNTMKNAGCEVVNMDTLSVFCAAELCHQNSENLSNMRIWEL